MPHLASALTDDDFDVIHAALDEWKLHGPKKSQPSRMEKANLIMAKLALHRRDVDIDLLTSRRSKLDADHKSKLAEEFIRDCGIWSHFQTFIDGQVLE